MYEAIAEKYKGGKIAFQGQPGSYSQIACAHVFPAMDVLPCTAFEDAFAAVADGTAALAMIPIDNSVAGRVADVHHLLPNSGLYIVGEHYEEVHHHLLAVKGATLKTIRRVRSHVHAVAQCRKLIRKLGLTPPWSPPTPRARRRKSPSSTTRRKPPSPPASPPKSTACNP